MWNAVDRYRASRGRVGVIEAEEGDHAVDVDEQYGSLISHLCAGR
jgi:hypothetical protein